MRDMIMMLAKMAPFELLVEQLQEAIEKYNLDPSEENKNRIGFQAMIIASHLALEKQDLVSIMKDMDEIDRARKLFKTGEN